MEDLIAEVDDPTTPSEWHNDQADCAVFLPLVVFQ
jgi:hypothetical protein